MHNSFHFCSKSFLKSGLDWTTSITKWCLLGPSTLPLTSHTGIKISRMIQLVPAVRYQSWNPWLSTVYWLPGASDCVKLSITNGRWNDIPCSTKLQFLCSQPPSESKVPDTGITDGICQGRQSQGKGGSVIPPGTGEFQWRIQMQPY